MGSFDINIPLPSGLRVFIAILDTCLVFMLSYRGLPERPANVLCCFDNFVLCFDNFVLCFDNFVLCFENFVLCFDNFLLCFDNFVLCFDNFVLCFDNLCCVSIILCCVSTILCCVSIILFCVSQILICVSKILCYVSRIVCCVCRYGPPYSSKCVTYMYSQQQNAKNFGITLTGLDVAHLVNFASFFSATNPYNWFGILNCSKKNLKWICLY